ncbi:MAG TPA: class D sortase [Candidatus Udaeobacter sp.]|nr:class D sortase [Candidatus Udaeobacter sp.]
MSRPPATKWTRVLRGASALCLVAGLVLLAQFGYGMWKGVSEQQHLNQVWRYQVMPRTVVPKGVDAALKQPVNGIDFAIEVPKLNYFAAVKEGTDSGVLYAGPGHYTTTGWPGDPGTVGVAAHNVYWIDFPQLSKGDEIDVQTRYGVYRYRVTDTEIVNPSDRTALVPHADGYHLTLTTCWPLWAGAFATQRYIIHTDQVWPTPLAPGYT